MPARASPGMRSAMATVVSRTERQRERSAVAARSDAIDCRSQSPVEEIGRESGQSWRRDLRRPRWSRYEQSRADLLGCARAARRQMKEIVRHDHWRRQSPSGPCRCFLLELGLPVGPFPACHRGRVRQGGEAMALQRAATASALRASPIATCQSQTRFSLEVARRMADRDLRHRSDVSKPSNYLCHTSPSPGAAVVPPRPSGPLLSPLARCDQFATGYKIQKNSLSDRSIQSQAVAINVRTA